MWSFFFSKIAQTCSNDGFKKVNRNVQYLFTPPFRSRSPSLIPHYFCQNKSRSSWTEWGGDVNSSFWWHQVLGVFVGRTADLGHFKIIYHIYFNNNTHQTCVCWVAFCGLNVILQLLFKKKKNRWFRNSRLGLSNTFNFLRVYPVDTFPLWVGIPLSTFSLFHISYFPISYPSLFGVLLFPEVLSDFHIS